MTADECLEILSTGVLIYDKSAPDYENMKSTIGRLRKIGVNVRRESVYYVGDRPVIVRGGAKTPTTASSPPQQS